MAPYQSYDSGLRGVTLAPSLEDAHGAVSAPSSRVNTSAWGRPVTASVNAGVPEPCPLPARRWYARAKAVGDPIFALVLLVLSTPLILLTALLVKLTSRGPVFYTQTRLGQGGRPFVIYKFRTMTHDCERLTGPCWSSPGDPRVTRVGRWLRDTHIDELPQLWNVLRGEMRLVGPRPERPQIAATLEQKLPRYRERLRVPPGLTGLAQVQLPPDTNLADVRKKLALDLCYMRCAGPWLDLRIVAATALHLLHISPRVARVLLRLPEPEGRPGVYRQAVVGLPVTHRQSPLSVSLAFPLLILLNGILFIRPAEIIRGLEGLPLYLYAILACILASHAALVAQLQGRALLRRPISTCVLGMLAAVVLSHLFNGSLWGVRTSGVEYAKLLLYYFLLVGVLDSPRRLRWFLGWFAGCVLVVTVVAVIQYHGLIDLAAVAPVQELGTVRETGEEVIYRRLCSAGIFHDPNDFSMLLVPAMVVSAYFLGGRGLGPLRYLWLAPLLLFGYALTLTQSRGGFIALLGGLCVLGWQRFGWRKALGLAALTLPVLFLAFGGRQTNLTTAEGTGQARLQLWSEGFAAFRHAPLFGIGQGRYEAEVGMVAHNSYVHCYTELGFFGGTLFVGSFYLALWSLHRLGARSAAVADPDLRRLRPFLMAVVTGYAGGMLSLSRAYSLPTFLVLGVVTAYLGLAARGASLPELRFDGHLVRRLALVSIACVAGTYVFLRLFLHWG